MNSHLLIPLSTQICSALGFLVELLKIFTKPLAQSPTTAKNENVLFPTSHLKTRTRSGKSNPLLTLYRSMEKHSSKVLRITCLNHSLSSVSSVKSKEKVKEEKEFDENNLSPVMHIQVQNGGDFKVNWDLQGKFG